MKITLKRFLLAVVTFAVIGLALLVSGVFPIKASSGHWPITAWFLDYASDRSVAFHSQGIDVPVLDDPELVVLGASIYQSNCQFCHGQPGQSQPPVARAMTPTPPQLSRSVAEIQDQELFYIIKHGIKFAGMPAWPTQPRDDGVWPVVAFVRAIPSMDNESYRSLVNPPADEQWTLVAEACSSCHGMNGEDSLAGYVPILAGQSEAHLRESLIAYRNGDRHSGIMMPIAHRLTDTEIVDLATYFAEKAPAIPDPSVTTDADLIADGQLLAEFGDRQRKIPSCVDCHGPDNPQRNDDYPRLAGQPAWYIERHLELFSKRNRGGSLNATLMHPIADKLKQEDRRALAAYYASIAP
ncbi:c-type cytochrome [Neorhodopirellula pilleata]|uniref:Cytochrome c-552 n=1 Tax=Neorhodopirellula pilleata TaxID=2714738 RepID=A0A5C6A5H8_9BACT|nr:c-type cytochrome [Neorhodopirellula pilleata]TWT94321.1 Cytochrome c-552 precursor [Neorhodopirellula pilleata]